MERDGRLGGGPGLRGGHPSLGRSGLLPGALRSEPGSLGRLFGEPLLPRLFLALQLRHLLFFPGEQVLALREPVLDVGTCRRRLGYEFLLAGLVGGELDLAGGHVVTVGLHLREYVLVVRAQQGEQVQPVHEIAERFGPQQGLQQAHAAVLIDVDDPRVQTLVGDFEIAL